MCYLAPHHHTRLNELSLLNEDAKEAQSKSHKRVMKTFKSREIRKNKKKKKPVRARKIFDGNCKSAAFSAESEFSLIFITFLYLHFGHIIY